MHVEEEEFPKSLWGEVVTIAVYIMKRRPTKKLKNKVLEGVWSDKWPSISHLKVFGSIFYKYVPDARRKKLDDKSEPMILVGYHMIVAYGLFNPINDKIMMSWDIVIDENYVWDWSLGDVTNKPSMGWRGWIN